MMPSLELIFSHPKNSFSASHFLIGFSKCDRLHGHNYRVKVRLQYTHVDLASSIDFRSVNAAIQHEMQLLNQKILLPKDSPKLQIKSTLKGKNWQIYVADKEYSFPKEDVRILDGIVQTTAENLAYYFHNKLGLWLQQNYPNMVTILDVTIVENRGNQAKFSASI